MAKSSNKLKMGHFVRFLVQKRTIKFSFEIYWPLRSYWKCIPEFTKNLTMKYTSKHLIIVYFCIYMGCMYDWLLIFDFGFRENSLSFFLSMIDPVKGLLEKSWIYLDLKKTMNCRNTLNTLNFMSLFCTQKVDVLRLHILFILIKFLVLTQYCTKL